MTWIDLSVPLRTGMPVYPGDPEVRIEAALTVDDDGANVLALGIGSHSGTHADAPLHVGNGWDSLDELPLGIFGGVVELADVRDVGQDGAIAAGHLASIAPALSPIPGSGRTEKILLLHTGFGAHWGTDGYLNHPWLTAAAARLIVERGYRTVALDALSVDPSSRGAAQDATSGGHGFPAHEILAGSGCAIIENLTGLEHIQRTLESGTAVEVFLFPLNIPGADGAPVRAVARPLEPQAPRALSLEEVQDAADSLIAAFAASDTEAYFAAFSPKATFIFHPENGRLESRDAYRTLWDSWVRSGWRVADCSSSEQSIQLLGTSAVFSHRVATTVQTDRAGGREASDERETIVFTRARDGSVLCVHEHLSLCPVVP